MSSINDAVSKMMYNESCKGRPVTTLFMLTSVDGKISTGASDECDFDADLLFYDETRDGLQQYYDIEKTTDYWCMCTGKTKAKIGINKVIPSIERINACIVILDNHHLTTVGITNLTRQYERVVLFTSNAEHPALSLRNERLSTHFGVAWPLMNVLGALYRVYDIKNITIQTGGETNGYFFANHLIDYVDIVVAPIVVGGKDTPTIVDGVYNSTRDNIQDIAFLELEQCVILSHGYLHLRYRVTNSK